jgi:hypothetical protein
MISSLNSLKDNFRPELIYEPAVDYRMSSVSVFNVPFVPKMSPLKSKFSNEILPGLNRAQEGTKPIKRDLLVVNMLPRGNLTLDVYDSEVWNDNPEFTYIHNKHLRI